MKVELRMLERLFAAEIEDRLPFQSKAKIMQKLADEGYIQPMRVEFGEDRFGAIVVDGWQLTHLGRLTYCISCPDPDAPASNRHP